MRSLLFWPLYLLFILKSNIQELSSKAFKNIEVIIQMVCAFVECQKSNHQTWSLTFKLRRPLFRHRRLLNLRKMVIRSYNSKFFRKIMPIITCVPRETYHRKFTSDKWGDFPAKMWADRAVGRPNNLRGIKQKF